jgi:hypothetical protein
MTKFLILILALTGCSGEAFTGFTPSAPIETDGGFEKIAAGGSQGEDDGGVLPTGTGGRGTGGATSTGGATAVGTGGTLVATGGSAATGGALGSGGTPGTGGATGTGGVTATGGTTATGGVTATGETTACTLVTHDNGFGHPWHDCVPLYTYNRLQATKACEASSGASTCVVGFGCVTGEVTMCGPNGCWEYAGNMAGYAKNTNGDCAPYTKAWN